MADQSYQPTLAQLRAFASIAEHRHFGEAAAALGISQPALSQALATLEAGLGVSLVERSTRRVLVTDAGRVLHAQAEQILSSAQQFVNTAAGMHGELIGSLRFGVIPTVAPYLLPPVLAALRTKVPDLAISVIEDQTAKLLDRLRAGTLDCAVLALPALTPGIAEMALYDEEFVLAVPPEHPDAGACDLDLAAIAREPLLLLDEGHCLRDQTLDLCRDVAQDGVSLIADTRLASLATVVRCVAGGLGVTLLPETAVATETAGTGLAIARFTAPAPGRRIGLVHRASSAESPGLAVLAAIMREAIAELPVTPVGASATPR